MRIFGSKNFSGNGNNNDNSVYRELVERIAQLEFNAFQTLTFLWLGARGYHQIRSLGRRHPRGRRPIGGADFVADSPCGDGTRVAIQVRHWRTPLQRRAVDELWGFMLRRGIPCGLILAKRSVSDAAVRAASEYPGRPIRLISAAGLAGSMVSLGLGVHPKTGVDNSFFRSLSGLRLGHGSSALARQGQASLGPDFQPTPEGPAPEHQRRLIAALLGALALALILLLVGGRR